MFPEFISISVPIAGVTFEGRQSVLADTFNGDKLFIVPEPFNRYDSEAIAVINGEGDSLGFIPRSFAQKRELFALLMDDEQFVCCASKKRGGGRYSFGMDVDIEYVPFKDETDEPIAKQQKHGKHPTNRHELNAKHKYKEYYVLLNHGFDSKKNRSYFKRKLRDDIGTGKSNLAKLKGNYHEPWISPEEAKAIVLG